MLNWIGIDQSMKTRETSRAIDKKLWVNNYLNNDLYLKKYGNLFQANFCNEQTKPNTAWNGFFHYQIADVLFVYFSSNED
jgi:hypothetical protein